MRNVIQLCLAANNILLMREWNHAFLLLAIALAWKWQIASQMIKNKLSDRMIRQFWIWLSQNILTRLADQLFASANNWSACH